MARGGFIIHQIHNPEWCIRKHMFNSKNCSIIIQNMRSKDIYDTVRFIVTYENWATWKYQILDQVYA